MEMTIPIMVRAAPVQAREELVKTIANLLVAEAHINLGFVLVLPIGSAVSQIVLPLETLALVIVNVVRVIVSPGCVEIVPIRANLAVSRLFIVVEMKIQPVQAGPVLEIVENRENFVAQIIMGQAIPFVAILLV